MLWEEERNLHLLTERYLKPAEPLLHLLAEYSMQQALPKDMPILQSLATKNWTRPNNVFCTENMWEFFTHCYTEPKFRDCTDHIPILSVLELETPKVKPESKRNYCNTDWKEFNEVLERELTKYSPTDPIVTDHEFQHSTAAITQAIQTVTEETVPMAKYIPTSKRWWNHNLTTLRKSVQKAAAESHKTCALPEHPSHKQHHMLRNQYSETIKKTKLEHWYDWLKNATMADVWIADKYINAEPGDGGLSRIPTLKAKTPDGQQITANTNDDKSQLLARTFFPP
jgi:hypothetical protein